MPRPQLPTTLGWDLGISVKDRLPWEHKEAMYIHVIRDTRQKRNGNKCSLSFPLFLKGGPFFVQNFFFFQSEQAVPQAAEIPRTGFVAPSPCTAE